MKNKKITFNKIPSLIFFTVSVIYMESVLKLLTCNTFFDEGLIFMFAFSVVCGLLIKALCSLFDESKVRWAASAAMFVLFVIYATQTIYHCFFSKYLIVFSLTSGGVGQVLSGDIANSTVDAILDSLPIIFFLILPTLVCLFFYDKIVKIDQKVRKGYVWLVSAILLHIAITFVISFIPSVSLIQSGLFDPNLSVSSFGLLRTETLDIKYNLFKIPQKMELEEAKGELAVEAFVPSDDLSYNMSDIDFLSLYETEEDDILKMMNGYFAKKEPTAKNEYTGMYKGYNLIMIVAEGFSPYAIDEELTPALYKMQQEGFKFTNFYTPIWGVSTSDGEYAVCTGLLPKAGVWSFYLSGENYMPYCLGNMFEKSGVNKTFAYHNNSYTYYHRNISHPNMGYDFEGIGSGVEEYVENVWPQSDLEMIVGSMTDYISSDNQFHAYYMTVSGHLPYERGGNSMVDKNWALVKDLDCSDILKGYYACNIELDRAVAALLEELNESGVADKTVIAITPDHYPYGLELDGSNEYDIWKEMLGHDVDSEFELYKSCFLLYCPGTDNAPTIDKNCYSADILPTLLNLFGFDYDSRLLMGSDILSESDELVILSDRSFICKYGKYSSADNEFYAFDESVFKNESAKEEYIDNMTAKVNNIFRISAKILETDYYRYVFEKMSK